MATVLVVDDAAIMRAKLCSIVENELFYRVVAEAATGVDAISLYEIHMPDLVTMDITMPEMSGLDAIDGILKINRNAKIIIISAAGMKKNVYDAIRKGAKNFIVKPFDTSKVVETIRETMRGGTK